MTISQNILKRVAKLEDKAASMQNLSTTILEEAAELRQELQAGGRPATPRKGKTTASIQAANAGKSHIINLIKNRKQA